MALAELFGQVFHPTVHRDVLDNHQHLMLAATSGTATLFTPCPNSPCALLLNCCSFSESTLNQRGQPFITDQNATINSVVSMAHCAVRFMGTCGKCSGECFCYLLDDLCHVLSALVLQPGQLEQLCNPPDADNVVLIKDLSQGPATKALEPRQQVHVCHAQHIVGVFRGQLAMERGKLLSSPTHLSLVKFLLLLCLSRDSVKCCLVHYRTSVNSTMERQELNLSGLGLALSYHRGV